MSHPHISARITFYATDYNNPRRDYHDNWNNNSSSLASTTCSTLLPGKYSRAGVRKLLSIKFKWHPQHRHFPLLLWRKHKIIGKFARCWGQGYIHDSSSISPTTHYDIRQCTNFHHMSNIVELWWFQDVALQILSTFAPHRPRRCVVNVTRFTPSIPHHPHPAPYLCPWLSHDLRVLRK